MEEISDKRELSEGQNKGNDVILFILVGLILGQILKHLANKTKIPYTPILTIAGIVVGLITQYIGNWGAGAEIIAEIDPHTFFLIFLPPLIFESSFSIDWHIIKVEIVQILILAGPCLVVSAFLTAVAMRYILQYQDEFTFEAAVMFGALISATDPVAVVSLLKELGASRTLSTLIEGESLINDGTAYVMFTVALDLVKGVPFHAGEITLVFFRLSFGGPLLGVILGMGISFWLRRVTNNSLLETNLTIVTSYMVFYVAEMWHLEVSGILALVGLGLYMTKIGKTRISSQSEETLHHIWSYLGFAAETIVFILAGVMISLKVFREDNIIGWEDYLKLLALYVILHVIRFGMIFALKWPMSKLGYGLNWPQACVLGFAGLRGAVSLILALIVNLDHDIDHHIKDIVLFHTAGIAILTLIINGTTMGFVVRSLGLMRMSNVKKKVLKNLVKAYRKEVNEVIEELKVKKNFGRIEWDILKQMACADKIRDQIFKKRDIKKEPSDMLASSRFQGDELVIDRNEYTFDELYLEAKHRYLTTLKGIYWEIFESGQCSSRTVLLLIESADRAIDHAEDNLKDFTFIETYFQASWFMKLLLKMKRSFIFKPFVKNYLYNNISFMYDVTVNYVEAHEECLKMIPSIVQNEEILQRLHIEVDSEVKHAENKLDRELEENFPEVIKAVQHKRGGYFLINRMRAFVNEMIEHGQIDFKEAKFFLHWLNKEERNLQLNKLKIDFEEGDLDFKTNCELAKLFSKDQLDELCKTFKEHTFSPNDIIIRKGETIRNLYYISKGVVHEKNGGISDIDAPKIRNRAGDVLGLQFITKDEGKSFTNCYAKTVCTCHSFPISALRGLLSGKEQEKRLWNYIGPSIIQLNRDNFSRLRDLDVLQLKSLMKNSTYEAYEKGQRVSCERGAILFEGELTEESEKQAQENINYSLLSESEKELDDRTLRIQNYAFIYPTSSTYRANSEIRLYALPEVLRDSWLAFNAQVLADAFSQLPGAGASVHHQNTLRDKQNTYLRKQNLLMLGIPKELAHENPIHTFRTGGVGAHQNKSSLAYGLPSHLQGQIGDGTIMPRGYTRVLTKLPEPSKEPIHEKVDALNLTKKSSEMVKKAELDHEESKHRDIGEIETSDIRLKEKRQESSGSNNSGSNDSGDSNESSGDNKIVDEEEEESAPQSSYEHEESSLYDNRN